MNQRRRDAYPSRLAMIAIGAWGFGAIAACGDGVSESSTTQPTSAGSMNRGGASSTSTGGGAPPNGSGGSGGTGVGGSGTGGSGAGASGTGGGGGPGAGGSGTAGVAGSSAGGSGASGAGAGGAGRSGNDASVADSAGGSGAGGTGAGGAGDSGGSIDVSGRDGGAGSGVGDAAPPPGNLCLKTGPDYAAPGPYTVATKAVDLGGTLGPYTVFYPSSMETSCPHPIAAWGNGTGVSDSTSTYAFFNNHAASWGIVVMAAANPSVGSGAWQKAALDWLLAQNKDSSSIFYNKLGTRAGVAGHSQGGIGASAATQHPNVQAEVCVQGGGTPKPGTAVICLTGTADQLNASCNAVYKAATGPAFFANYQGGDHTTTPTLAGWITKNPGTIQFVRLHTAWYRCFLADDASACSLFKGGTSCGICKDANWAALESRNL
jgi:hypothetical protein